MKPYKNIKGVGNNKEQLKEAIREVTKEKIKGKMKERASGFTLIEILVVMGIIAVLATIVLVAINPSRQFAQSRDTQRIANVNAILNAVSERTADHRGIFEENCPAGVIPASTTPLSSAGFNIYPCIIPTYISALPLDPRTGLFTSETNYVSGYTIMRDAATGRIVISAPATEIASGTISVTR